MAEDILAIGQGGRRGGNVRSDLVPRRPTPPIAKRSQSAADGATQGPRFVAASGQARLRGLAPKPRRALALAALPP